MIDMGCPIFLSSFPVEKENLLTHIMRLKKMWIYDVNALQMLKVSALHADGMTREKHTLFALFSATLRPCVLSVEAGITFTSTGDFNTCQLTDLSTPYIYTCKTHNIKHRCGRNSHVHSRHNVTETWLTATVCCKCRSSLWRHQTCINMCIRFVNEWGRSSQCDKHKRLSDACLQSFE